jgi:hypothetical protein
MRTNKSTAPVRAFYLFAATVLWLGIWHTGFSIASWVLYVPAVTFVFAAATGICPSYLMFKSLLARD